MTSVLRCAACRAFVQADDRFCWSCGSQLDRSETAGSVRATPREGPSEVDPEVALVLRQAYLAQQRRQYGEAERLVKDALSKHPESVPALSMLAGILRAKGDLIGAVAVSQQVSEAAASGTAPRGAVDYARGERARIEEQVVREMGSSYLASETPLAVLWTRGGPWYRSRHLYLALTAMGFATLLLALSAVTRGASGGFVWFAVSLLCAGWCYSDLQARREQGLLWVPFVLGLGPFGLAVYLLATH